MFFSTTIDKHNLVEKIQSADPVAECAKIKMLRDENKKYDFLLYSSYCSANDISLSHERFINGRPSLWNRFTHFFYD